VVVDPALVALRSEARVLEGLVEKSRDVVFRFDPEDTIVVLGGIVEMAFSQSQHGRVLGVCMGRLEGVFNAVSGDIQIKAHGFVPVDDRQQSALLVGLDVPLSGFAVVEDSGAPHAWLEAKDVFVGKRPSGGRASWRAFGQMLGIKPGRVLVGPINGYWSPVSGGRWVVQGAWAVSEIQRL
jgi:hypothetical protein